MLTWWYQVKNGVVNMAKVQIGPRIEQEIYDKLVEKIGGKENVNKTVIQLIEDFVNGVQDIVQTSQSVGGQDIVQIQQPTSKEQDQFPEGTLKPEDFKNRLDYVDYLERMGLIYEDE